MNAAQALGDKLIALGVANAVPNALWPVYYAKMPAGSAPNACVVLYNSGGGSPFAKWLFDFPSVQVRIRGEINSYLASRAKAQEVKDALFSSDPWDTAEGRIRGVLMQGDLMDLAFDEQNRPHHVINFRLEVEPATGTNRVPIS